MFPSQSTFTVLPAVFRAESSFIASSNSLAIDALEEYVPVGIVIVPEDTSSTEIAKVLVPDTVKVELELNVEILFPLLKAPTFTFISKYALLAGLLVTALPSIFFVAVSIPKAVLEILFWVLLGKVIWLAEIDPSPTIPNW